MVPTYLLEVGPSQLLINENVRRILMNQNTLPILQDTKINWVAIFFHKFYCISVPKLGMYLAGVFYLWVCNLVWQPSCCWDLETCWWWRMPKSASPSIVSKLSSPYRRCAKPSSKGKMAASWEKISELVFFLVPHPWWWCRLLPSKTFWIFRSSRSGIKRTYSLPLLVYDGMFRLPKDLLFSVKGKVFMNRFTATTWVKIFRVWIVEPIMETFDVAVDDFSEDDLLVKVMNKRCKRGNFWKEIVCTK